MYLLVFLLLIIILLVKSNKQKENFRDIPLYDYLKRPIYIGKYPYYMSVFNYYF